MEKLRLRFRRDDATNFSDWTEVCLEDVGEIRTGTTPNIKDLKNIGGSYLWVTPTDITGKEVTVTATTLSKEGMDVAREIPANSVLVTCIASIGKNCVLRNKGSCNQQINSITPKFGYDVDFLYYLICRKESVLHSFAGHGGMEILNKSEFSKLIFKFPSFEEQQKIAAFLTALDEKILLIDKTIASLNDLKRGLMDRLFKRRVRFNGKDGTTFGKWRLSTIGAEGTFYYGKSAPKWSLSDTATTPCIRYGDLYTKHEYVVKDVDTYTEIEREKLVFSKGGEVLVPRVGEDPLDFCKCAYLPMKNIAIGEMISVYETDNDGLYISYYFNSQMKKTFAKYVEGGNVSNLYYTYLEGIELEVPTIDEQKRISDFLSVLIEKIDVNKNKKEKYVTLKRAFMQQMFV